jgi:hypothetical protein
VCSWFPRGDSNQRKHHRDPSTICSWVYFSAHVLLCIINRLLCWLTQLRLRGHTSRLEARRGINQTNPAPHPASSCPFSCPSCPRSFLHSSCSSCWCDRVFRQCVLDSVPPKSCSKVRIRGDHIHSWLRIDKACMQKYQQQLSRQHSGATRSRETLPLDTMMQMQLLERLAKNHVSAPRVSHVSATNTHCVCVLYYMYYDYMYYDYMYYHHMYYMYYMYYVLCT